MRDGGPIRRIGLGPCLVEVDPLRILRHGGEALLHCERHSGKIELLLTDVVLEQMSGTELSARLATTTKFNLEAPS